MEKTKTVVKIAGIDYPLSGYASEEYLHSVAIYVNRKMEAIANANTNLSTSMLAVLTALNITDELFQARASQNGNAGISAEEQQAVSELKNRIMNPTKE